MKIIVVDDEISALSTFLSSIVDDVEIECKMFMEKPDQALEYVKTEDVAAAFLDVKMPEIDGVTLAEKMLDARPDLKIIFISAFADNEDEILKRFEDKSISFCHKPYRKELLVKTLANLKETGAKKKPFLKTFDSFDLFVDGVAVDFSSTKAKELLALLTDAKGSYVTMDTAIGNLWPNKNLDLAKRLYRDAVSRLRLTLSDAGVDDLVTFERARSVINVNAATCDLWDYMEKGGKFSGRYMPQYDWSIVTESFLQK